jgi:hypothetical protein
MQGVPIPPIVSKDEGDIDANTIRTVEATDSQVSVTAAMGDPRILSPNGLGVTVSDSQVAEAQSQDQPIFVAITGDPAGDFAGVNILEQLVDEASLLGLGVRVLNPQKVDSRNALISSDAPDLIRIQGMVGSFTVIDTAGYSTLHVTTQTFAGTIAYSNDGITWNTGSAYLSPGGSVSGNLVGSSNYSIPCLARYIRFTTATAGLAWGFLRRDPLTATFATNLNTIGGAAIGNGGGAGVFPVGGTSAAAAAPSANPVVAAGVDSGEVRLAAALTGLVPVPLTRRILTDTLGRQRLTNEVAPVSQFTNVPALNVQDTTQFEGQSVVDLLAQILTELKVMNLQIQAIPAVLNSGGVLLDDPADLRSDPSLFN